MIQSSDKKFDFEEGAVIKHDLNKAPKTGDWRYMTPKIDKDKCSGCMTCVPYCPEASIEMKPYECGAKTCLPAGRDKADIDYDFCKGCGVCATVCPMKAITMEKN